MHMKYNYIANYILKPLELIMRKRLQATCSYVVYIDLIKTAI